MVADQTTSTHSGAASALSTLSPALSALDRALLTRLYTLPTPSLEALLASLTDHTIEDAPSTLFDLSEWANQDHIKPRIETRAAQVRDSEQREMIALLKELAKTSENPIEKRRAATTVLKALGLGALYPLRVGRASGPPSSPRTGGRGVGAGGGDGERSIPTHTTSTPSSSSSSSSTSPPPKPKFAPPVIYHTSQQQDLLLALCAEGPGKVPNPWGSALAVAHNTPNHAVRFILNALQNMTEPGLITLFNFTGPMDRSLHAFQAFIPTIEKLFPTRFKSYEVLSITQTGDHTFTAEILITNHDDSTKPLTLRFHRPTTGIHLHCWHLKLPDSS